MNDKLPLSFQDMFLHLSKPNGTKSLRLEKGQNIAFRGFPTFSYQERGILK